MKAKDERKELEQMLNKSPDNLNKNLPQSSEEISDLKIEPIMDIDFEEIKSKCEIEARSMVLNSIKFILPSDMISGNDYLQNKIDVDSLSLSGMIYQLRVNEIMQKSLIEQVNLGMINPRMWEVFGQLSKIIGDLNKQLLQTVEAIQSTYKGIKDNIREQRTEALGPQSNSSGMITTGDGGIVTRGTKELINRVKSEKNINASFIDESELIPNINIEESPSA